MIICSATVAVYADTIFVGSFTLAVPSPLPQLLFHIPMLQNEKCKFWTMQTNDDTCDAMSGKVSVLSKSTWAQYFFRQEQ